MFIIFDPFIQYSQTVESLGQTEFNAPNGVILCCDRFSAILVYVKNLQKAFPITNIVQSFRHLAPMIFRPSLTKNIEQIFHIQIRLAVKANQIRP